MSFLKNIYLEGVREEWVATIEGKGGTCPCCDRWGKVNKLSLSQHLALCLRWIYLNGDKNDDGWVHVQNKAPRWMLKSKTYSTLEHWGLIEGMEKRSGVWRATPKGIAFQNSSIMVPASVYIYNKKVWGIDSVETSFQGCFGKHFNFDEMMSERFDWSNVVKD